MKLQDLIGERLLSGIDVVHEETKVWHGVEIVDIIRFIIDDVTYEAVEDPADGYRSRCDTLIVTDKNVTNKFAAQRVLGIMKPDDTYRKNDTIQFLDIENGKLVLEIGTDNCDDYYPYCVLNWIPENLSINEEK